MSVSVSDIFKIGIGPSSSHTVGPMKAGARFCRSLVDLKLTDQVESIHCELFGSLALTGKGHGSDKAIILGLMGEEPESVDVESIDRYLKEAESNKKLDFQSKFSFNFCPNKNIEFLRSQNLPLHPNGMRFTAKCEKNSELLQKIYYSVGGGFVINHIDGENAEIVNHDIAVKYPFSSADEILEICEANGISISKLMKENEKSYRTESETLEYLDAIWDCMERCIERGCRQEGILPGGLKVKRRAAALHRKLTHQKQNMDPLSIMDWVDLWALAVNEENAAGGKVVTAPTNGAAGIIPAVIKYYTKVNPEYQSEDIERFLLTAGAIGILYKLNASISGAEVGCQGEVGVACSMAAAGLTEVMGGTPEQVENAAEIGMEHNLGLTCDPVGGLVQVPCIERNAMGAIKAINASRLSMQGDGSHKVSLDKVIKTMRETGQDMQSKYKETARGGLAVNIIEC